MVWNKTPEVVLQEIYDKTKQDYTKTFKEIAILLNVSEWLVSETWRKRSTSTERKERYSAINRQAKLGNKNPQFGNIKLANHQAKDVIIISGYRCVWAPEWWQGCYPKPNRVFEHQYIWCLHNNITSIPVGYVIHHKDHNKLNNDISNLELMSRSAHMSYHATERATTRRKAVENSVLEVQSPTTVGDDIV